MSKRPAGWVPKKQTALAEKEAVQAEQKAKVDAARQQYEAERKAEADQTAAAIAQDGPSMACALSGTIYIVPPPSKHDPEVNRQPCSGQTELVPGCYVRNTKYRE